MESCWLDADEVPSLLSLRVSRYARPSTQVVLMSCSMIVTKIRKFRVFQVTEVLDGLHKQRQVMSLLRSSMTKMNQSLR